MFADPLPVNCADGSVETVGLTLAGAVCRKTAEARNDCGAFPSEACAVQVTTVLLAGFPGAGEPGPSVIAQLRGTDVVPNAPDASRGNRLNCDGLIVPGSIGSENVTMNPFGAVVDGLATTEAPTLRVVKLFTSLQSPVVQPSALSAFPVVGLVIVVAARTSYFWPYFGWYEAGRVMVNSVGLPVAAGATVNPGIGVVVVPVTSEMVNVDAFTPCGVLSNEAMRPPPFNPFKLAGRTSVRRSRFTVTTVTPGIAAPVFAMFVFDVAVSWTGSRTRALRRVAVVNSPCPPGRVAVANTFGTAAGFTLLQDNVYAVSGINGTVGVSRINWWLKPARKAAVVGTIVPAASFSVNVPTGLPAASAATGDENSTCGLVDAVTGTGSVVGVPVAEPSSVWVTVLVVFAWFCACAPFTGVVLRSPGDPGCAENV